MAFHVKPFSCQVCKKCFTGRVNNCAFMQHFPYVLLCGHSICITCLKQRIQAKSIMCPICKHTTSFSSEEKIMDEIVPDYYALGILSACNKGFSLNLKPKLTPTESEKHSKSQAFNQQVCHHCQKCAAWYCQKCSKLLCTLCFIEVHDENKSIGIHEAIPIYIEEYRSILQNECSEHNHCLQFFCEDDDKMVCKLCAISDEHKGHTICEISEKNESFTGEILEARNMAENICEELIASKKKLLEAKPNCSVNGTVLKKEIADYFHELHSHLQLREAELIATVDTKINESLKTTENLITSVTEDLLKLKSIIRDADQLLKNPSTAINGLILLKRLQQAKETCCYLISVAAEEDIIRFSSENEVKQIIRIIGHVEALIRPRFSLVAEHELPVEFRKDSLEEERSVSSIDSTVTDVIPVIPEIKPLKMRIMKPKIVKTVETEEVMVTHIRTPSSFFVQRIKDLETFSHFMSAINIWCKKKENKKFIPKSVEIGDMCLGRYSVDGIWYRARVKEICETSIVGLSNKKKKRKHKKDRMQKLLKEIKDVAQLAELKDENASLSDKDGSLKSILDDIQDESSESRTSRDDSVKEDAVIKRSTVILITFLDYGNTEKVLLSDIRVIQPQFTFLPSLALECSLWQTLPINVEWTSDAIRHFTRFTANRKMNMKIVEEIGGVLHVDLIQPPASISHIENDTPISIREALIFIDVAVFSNPNGNQTNLSRANKHQSFYNPDPLIHSLKMRVKVSHVDTPSRFYVQLVNPYLKYYNEMNDELQAFYNSSDGNDLLVCYPQKGLPYVTQLSTENGTMWFRVLAQEFPGQGQVTVFCVDTGICAVLHCTALRKITDRFLRETMQAHCCHLADVGPFRLIWDPEAIEWLKAKTTEDLQMVVHNNSPSLGNIVSLYETYTDLEDVSLNVKLVEGGMARCLGAGSIIPATSFVPKKVKETTAKPQQIVPKAARGVPSPDGSVKSIPTTTRAKKHPPTKVKVCHFESPNLFFVHVVDQEMQLRSLTKNLKMFYQKSSAVETTWKIGSICVAHSSKSNSWNRGRITKLLKDDSYEVFFHDYGYKETVSSDVMRKLHEDFATPDPLALQCSLGRVRPAGGSTEWTRSACERMDEQVKDQVLFLGKAQSETNNGSISVDLFKEELVPGGALEASHIKMCSISEKLIDTGTALPLNRRGTAEMSIEKDKPATPYVYIPPITQKWLHQRKPDWINTSAVSTFVGYDGCIYLHPKEMEPVLVEIQDGLQEAFESGRYHSPKEVIREGQICSAKFENDQKWYRAQIVKVVNATAEVIFVDYGNMEVIQIKDIRLHCAFINIPLQCYECELHNARPVSDSGQWPKDTLDYLHRIIVEKPCVINIEEHGTMYPKKRLQISLTLCGGVSLLDHLVERGMVRRIRSAPQEYITILLPNQNPDYKSLPLPPIGVRFPVTVTHVAHGGHLFMQRLKLDSPNTEDDLIVNKEYDRFIVMMEELNEKGPEFPIIDQPTPESTCCVQYSHDEKWYRALVTSVTNGWASVIYIDYGNPEDVPLSSERIRALPKEYMDYPKQSIIGRLYSVEPATGVWDMDLMKELMNLFFEYSGYTLLAEIKNKTFEVPDVELTIEHQDNDDSEVFYHLAHQPLIDSGILKKI